jgi:hypothetical protein
MFKNNGVVIVLLFISLSALSAQIGGNATYEFLRVPAAARVTALGGNYLGQFESDLALANHNPSALNPQMHQRVAFNQSVHLSGTTNGYVAYGHHTNKFERPWTFQAGLQYINYGTFNDFDVFGNPVGASKASEYALVLGAGVQPSERLSLGANLKWVLSYLGPYNSTGALLDLAAMYRDTSKRLVVSLVMKNLGTQFSTYNRDKNYEPMPFDVQLGLSHRLKFVPFRMGVVFNNIHRWGIAYDDPALQQSGLLGDSTNSSGTNAGTVVDEIFRHLTFSGELLFGKPGKEAFRIGIGYKHLRLRELKAPALAGRAGFSFGFGLRIRQFTLDYAYGGYHYAGAVHHFGLNINLQDLIKGKG